MNGKRPLVIFGIHDFAELAAYFFTQSEEYEVVAFTVDRAYVTTDSFQGKPVIAFEDLETVYPPDSVALFIAIGFQNLNKGREAKCTVARAKGYRLASYMAPSAVVWQGFVPGDNCLIMEQAVIQPFATIGNGVIICSGANVSHHSTLGDYIFMASHAVIGGHVVVGNRVFLGMNSTIKHRLTVGDDALIGAGALVLEAPAKGSVYTAVGNTAAPFSSRLAKNFL